MKGPEESYHQAMEKLVIGDAKKYEPNATSRPDYPTLTVQGSPSYSPENHEIYLESIGPNGGGPYSIVFKLSEKRIKHAYGTYENQQAPGHIKDINFLQSNSKYNDRG